MNGLEQAIRNALERAERSNPEIRSRIYQSARNALDTGLRKQEVDDPGMIERQRQRLETTIREIEDEELARLRAIARFEKVALEREPESHEEPSYQPVAAVEPEKDEAVETATDVAPAIQPRTSDRSEISVEAPRRTQPQMRIEPEIRVQADTRSVPSAPDDGTLGGFFPTRDDTITSPSREIENDDWQDTTAADSGPAEPARRSAGRRAGSFIVSLFVYIFLIGIIAAGVWWVYATGMIDAAMKGTSDFDLVPKELQSQTTHQQTQLDTLKGFSGEWLDIYKPDGSTTQVRSRSRATVEEARDSDGLATVISSNAPDQDGDVLVEVPASLLQDLAGKTSTLAITIKSNSEKPAQIYIQCEFTTLGNCGRHRFTVTNERADELIQVKFDGKLGPSEPGHIIINSDLTGEGSAVRLYGIRVLPGS